MRTNLNSLEEYIFFYPYSCVSAKKLTIKLKISTLLSHGEILIICNEMLHTLFLGRKADF